MYNGNVPMKYLHYLRMGKSNYFTKVLSQRISNKGISVIAISSAFCPHQLRHQIEFKSFLGLITQTIMEFMKLDLMLSEDQLKLLLMIISLVYMINQLFQKEMAQRFGYYFLKKLGLNYMVLMQEQSLVCVIKHLEILQERLLIFLN